MRKVGSQGSKGVHSRKAGCPSACTFRGCGKSEGVESEGLVEEGEAGEVAQTQVGGH